MLFLVAARRMSVLPAVPIQIALGRLEYKRVSIGERQQACEKLNRRRTLFSLSVLSGDASILSASFRAFVDLVVNPGAFDRDVTVVASPPLLKLDDDAPAHACERSIPDAVSFAAPSSCSGTSRVLSVSPFLLIRSTSSWYCFSCLPLLC